MIPCLLKRLLISILLRNQVNKIIPRKESVPLLQTQSDKEEKRDEQTRNTLHVKKTIIWINAKPSWKRLLRKESNSWPTKHYAMAGITP